ARRALLSLASLASLTGLSLALLAGSSRADASRDDSAAEAFRVAPELGQGFQALGTRGVIVLYDEPARRWTVSDARRAYQGFRPASTFKIPGTLIALDTGVAQDETQVFKWDGRKRWMEDWNQDQTLQTAFRFSAVWVFQHIARQVGAEGLQSRLWAWRYGNAVAGPKHDSFWLDGDLRITAVEQIDFLRRFAEHRLPLGERTVDIARRVFLRDETPDWRLYAKTGWDGSGPVELGWFVGWTERKSGAGRCFFALNMDMQVDAKALPKGAKKPTQHELIGQLGPQRERLAREALRAQGCLD
ncbi:MAG TPA: penicillin-binding transpeptidase domain-containing protein, partial [Burkholderiaceae bacterium]|nr:penicillin-binding transpeptidase domain-containing protein [Burkholderiaceae bacterium]